MKRILFRVNSIVSILSAVKLSLIVGVVFIIGCSKQLSFNELNNNKFDEVDFYDFKSLKMDFDIKLLKYLEAENTDCYDNGTLIQTFSDSTGCLVDCKNSGLLNIMKYNSKELVLSKEYERIQADRVDYENFQIISTEEINFIGKQVIYEYVKFTMGDLELEGITFLFKEKGNKYYNVYIQVNKDEYYPNNLKELLFCVKSMRTW
jgi:hypothetical protein